MSPHSERPHSLYYLTINNSQEEYLKLELPNHRWMYATKALYIPISLVYNVAPTEITHKNRWSFFSSDRSPRREDVCVFVSLSVSLLIQMS